MLERSLLQMRYYSIFKLCRKISPNFHSKTRYFVVRPKAFQPIEYVHIVFHKFIAKNSAQKLNIELNCSCFILFFIFSLLFNTFKSRLFKFLKSILNLALECGFQLNFSNSVCAFPHHFDHKSTNYVNLID